MLVLAITSGLLAGALALHFLRQQPRNLIAAEPRSTGKMVIAARDLAVGDRLRNEDVRLIDWPGNALPEGYAAATAQVIGRGVITAVKTNEPLLDSKLASTDAGAGLVVAIPEGMRALSVKVDEVVGVAGFVTPGTRVDVLVTIDPRDSSGNSEQTITRVILQNVQAVGAGQTIQQDPEGKPQTVSVVTVLVTPEEAEKLTLAANEGRIQLALRNTLDLAEVETPGVRAAALVRNSAPSAAADPGRQVRPRTRSSADASPAATVIETYKGGVRTLSTFSPRNP